MKILLIRTIAMEEDCSISTYNNQGIGLSTELSKLGHECGLIYYAKPGKGFVETIDSDGQKIKVYHVEGKSIFGNAIYENSIYDICNEYDIIQVSECDQIASWMIYKRFPEKTLIYHGPYKSKYTKKYNLRSKFFDLFFSNRANFKDAMVITKSFLAEDYLRNKGFKKIKTLGVGLNPKNLQRTTENIPKHIIDSIENNGDVKYLLYIGVISERKNLKFLLSILDDIVNIKKIKNCKLIIVGSKSDKETKYFEECFDFVKNNNLVNNIVYFDVVEQKYLEYLYKNSIVYVLPTQYDIFGMVYLEAMYFGIPVIASYCGGSSMLIENEKNGFICNLDNKEQWITYILKLLNDANLRKKISKNAIETINEYFTWEKLAKKFVDIYNEVRKSA